MGYSLYDVIPCVSEYQTFIIWASGLKCFAIFSIPSRGSPSRSRPSRKAPLARTVAADEAEARGSPTLASRPSQPRLLEAKVVS